MSNETPAQLLAAVLRVVEPSRRWLVLGNSKAVHGCSDDHNAGIVMRWPNSKDDLARVVAMLTPEQRGRFKEAFGDSFIERDPRCCVDLTMEMLLSDPSRHLAAIVAATGVEA